MLVGAVIATIVLGFAGLALSSWLVSLVWNGLLVPLFGLPPIDILMAYAIIAVFSLIGSVFRKG